MSGNLIGFITGFLSANIGIGGGTVLIPVMMSFGFLPSVISYTTSYLVVNNKIVASLVYFLTEVVPLDYLLIVGGIMFVSVFIMEFKSKSLLKRFGRQSYLSMIFVGLTILSIFLVAYSSIMDVIEKKKNN